MTPQDIISYFGSQAEAAKKLGCTRAIVSFWEKKNRVPVKTQLLIEVKTRRKLKADVSAIAKVKRAA